MSSVLQPRRGLTIVDLVVSLCVIFMLGSTVLTTTCRSRETADRVKCASNLRTIGQAILLYANENRFVYPMATYEPDTAHAPVAFTGAYAKNLADPDAPLSASLIGTPASAGDSILLPHASYDTLPWNPYKNRPILRWLAGVSDNWPKVLAAVVLLGIGLWMARVLLAKG